MEKKLMTSSKVTSVLSPGVLAALVVPFTLFVGLAKEVFTGSDAGRYDWFLMGYIHRFSTPVLDRTMLFFTFLGSVKFYTLVFPVTLAVLALWKRWRELAGMLGAFIGALALNELLKYSFHRIRPNLYLIKETGYSFPSGHAMISLVFYGMLIYFIFCHAHFRRWRNILAALAVFLTLAIGLSRIYLGVHYPSDVLGSYLAGFLWLVVTVTIMKLFTRVYY